MKKLILAASLMAGAAFASFAGVQVNYLKDGPHGDYEISFTFTSDGSYGLEFGGWDMGNEFINWVYEPAAFGYYYTNEQGELVGSFISGTLTGNNSNYFNTVEHILDVNTGFLGDFKAGDTIGIWVQMNGGDFYTTTDSKGQGQSMYTLVFDAGTVITDFAFLNTAFRFVDLTPPNGEPLPGVLAALAIGGCAFLGRKFRNNMKK